MSDTWQARLRGGTLALMLALAGCDGDAPGKTTRAPTGDAQAVVIEEPVPPATGTLGAADLQAPPTETVATATTTGGRADGSVPDHPDDECGTAVEPPPAEPATTTTTDEQVMAKVNGSPVTQAQWNRALDGQLAGRDVRRLEDGTRRGMLEALVARRAMAALAYEQLSAEQRQALQAQVAEHRELLLASRYMRTQVKPRAVTPEMVTAYYEAHPDKHGAATVREYERVSPSGETDESTRARLLAAYRRIEDQTDWQGAVQRLQALGLPVKYQRARAKQGLLDEATESRLAWAARNGRPAIHVQGGVPSLLRVAKEERIPPRPRSEVGARIRMTLMPVQLKEAIRAASARALAQVRVEYPQPEPEGAGGGGLPGSPAGAARQTPSVMTAGAPARMHRRIGRNGRELAGRQPLTHGNTAQ